MGALEDNKKAEATHDDLAAFRAQRELACQRELDSRVVMLTAVGSDAEIHASVTTTRLYQNRTKEATVMGSTMSKIPGCATSSRGKASSTVSQRWTRQTSNGTSSPSFR